MPILKGNGFILRSWKNSDRDSLSKHGNNKKIWKNLVDTFPHPYTKKKASEWIKDSTKAKTKKTRFAIVIDGKAVGGISFSLQESINERKVAHIGYWLSEDYWGKGIMSQAVKLMTRYIFKNFDVVRIQAGVFDYNNGSAKVLEKSGFKLEGRLRKNLIKEDKFYDELVYGKIKSN
jgi:RimJ/RimL family protein N-acetyltransferase